MTIRRNQPQRRTQKEVGPGDGAVAPVQSNLQDLNTGDRSAFGDPSTQVVGVNVSVNPWAALVLLALILVVAATLVLPDADPFERMLKLFASVK